MTTVERTIQIAATPANTAGSQDQAWVTEVLEADQLRLADAKRLEPYGRARLNTATRALMWAMRLYVLFSLVLIAAQLYISLHAR